MMVLVIRVDGDDSGASSLENELQLHVERDLIEAKD